MSMQSPTLSPLCCKDDHSRGTGAQLNWSSIEAIIGRGVNANREKQNPSEQHLAPTGELYHPVGNEKYNEEQGLHTLSREGHQQ